MTATNHTITGALIATFIPHPVVAIPLALLSHFVLDSLPHFGADERTGLKFKLILLTDASLAFLVLLSILIIQPVNTWLLVACGIAGASPDLMWFRYWVAELRGKTIPKTGIASFHSRIQRFEFRTGWLMQLGFGIEFIWFLVMGYTLLSRIIT